MNLQLFAWMTEMGKILKRAGKSGDLPPGKASLYWACRSYCEVTEIEDPEVPRLAGFQIDIGACSNYPWDASTRKQIPESEIKTELL